MNRLFEPRVEIPRPLFGSCVVLGFLLLVCAWQLASQHYAAQGKQILFPSPAKVWDAALQYRPSSDPSSAGNFATFASDVRVSTTRVLSAFLLAAATAIPLGVLVGAYRIAEAMIQPVAEFVRYVPVPALIPLLIVVCGIEETPKIMLIYIGTVFQLMLMVADEIRRVPYALLQAGYTLGGNRREVVRRILFPSALPGILDAVRSCSGWAWSWLIVAELVAANEGLGFRIVKYQRFLHTDEIFFYLIVLGFIGLAIDIGFRAVNRFAFPWNQPVRG
jgi:NitT/TauT family transport system permease protein